MPGPVQIVWFKKNLRVRDHAPLWTASQRGPVLPLFVFEPEQVAHPEFAGHHLTYLNCCLRELDASLSALGAPLVIRHGEVVAVLEGMRAELEGLGLRLGSLWAHEETGNAVSFARDRRVRAWARARGLPFTEMPQNGVVRRLRNRDGWAATWEARMAEPVLPAPMGLRGTGLASEGIRTHAALRVPCSRQPVPEGGEAAAHATLSSFLTERGANYPHELSSPLTAPNSCSRLSAPLAFGTVSLRTVVQATRQRLAEVRSDPHADPRWSRSLRAFENRLHWRCHFMQRLESEPDMEFRGLNAALQGLRDGPWNPERFDRWANGETGYPLVDACVRMLQGTGWLNFRMRALLVSFASQHLWLDWRPTGMWLARQWLDNEPGIHWSQVQMQSGVVGINRPRIYSPTRQAREQDPHGDFIRRWVPELASVPTDFIHTPWVWSGAGRLAYPAPIVDEGRAGREARARLAAARATPEFEAEARRVYARHGSRKKADLRAEREARGLPPRSPRPNPRRPVMTDQPDLFGQTPSTPAPIRPTGLPASWVQALDPEFAAPYFHELKDFLVAERRAHAVFPPAPDVFNALRFTPLDGVKVLILGQDPYHGPGQAHGLSFSVRPGVRVPPSLQNIYKELQTDLPGFTPPRHGYLRHWAEQGVLLLNAVLTVRQGEPNSHAGHGWETFTDAVIRAVNDKPERVVFVLWGAYARKKAKLVTGKQHVIVESAHPSPLSADRFFGSRPFSKVNAALEESGQAPIDWQLPLKVEQ